MHTEVVTILRATTGEWTEAELHHEVTVQQVSEAESKWRRIRTEASRHLIRGGAPPAEIPENWHWNWAAKVSHAKLSHIQLFGITCEGEWQGLMMTTPRGHKARLPPDMGKGVMYVKYIESAPWNVRSMTATPKFAAIGTRLIEAAVRYSDEIGYDGRIALHSLPTARHFYERLRFANMGPDVRVENLAYFELTATASRNL